MKAMQRNTVSCTVALVAALAAGTAQALTCSVAVEYRMTAQDGTPIDSELYENVFFVDVGVPFEDDFSTPTRFKIFTASVAQVRNGTVVTMTYFNDLTTFDSIDFRSQATLLAAQATETASGDYTFSTSRDPASGHYAVNYTLSCRR